MRADWLNYMQGLMKSVCQLCERSPELSDLGKILSRYCIEGCDRINLKVFFFICISSYFLADEKRSISITAITVSSGYRKRCVSLFD